MNNITCTEIEGAMYGFPRIHFSNKFIQEAKELGKAPDFLYCLEMVNKTGIMTVPGSGFLQQKGTHHFRITNLVTPNEKMEKVLDELKVWNNQWHRDHWTQVVSKYLISISDWLHNEYITDVT